MQSLFLSNTVLSHCSLAIQSSVADSENRLKIDRHIIGIGVIMSVLVDQQCPRYVYTGLSTTDSGG